jgi:hypothetical protein
MLPEAKEMTDGHSVIFVQLVFIISRVITALRLLDMADPVVGSIYQKIPTITICDLL